VEAKYVRIMIKTLVAELHDKLIMLSFCLDT